LIALQIEVTIVVAGNPSRIRCLDASFRPGQIDNIFLGSGFDIFERFALPPPIRWAQPAKFFDIMLYCRIATDGKGGAFGARLLT
jgi:hypothetical protein